MRLIDADVLSQKWQKVLDQKANEKDSIVYYIFELFMDRLKYEPTIEAEPVRHGKWVHTDKAASWKCKDECGECHYHTTDRVDLSCLNYCPDCGAKMDGKEKGE